MVDRLTYFEGGKWRLRIGSTEYSGLEVDCLAAYEDTGLEPEEIQTVLSRYRALRAAISDETGQPITDLAHLRELVEAEKEGRCVVLPDGMTADALRAAYTHATELADEVLPSPSYTTGHLNGFWSGQAAALRMVLGAEAEAAQGGGGDGV